MKLALVLGTCLASSLLSSAAFAQGPGPGEVKITNANINGSYYSGVLMPGQPSSEEDAAVAFIEATYKGPNGAPASGYVYGLPKMKYKFYRADGSLIVQPDIMDAAPFSFGGGGYGSSWSGTAPKCTTYNYLFWYENNKYVLPLPAESLIRHWKLLGYAGSQNATGGAEANVLAPTFSTVHHGAQIS